jgi:hypothetical protein
VRGNPHPAFEHTGARGRGQQQEPIAAALERFGRQGETIEPEMSPERLYGSDRYLSADGGS